MADNGNSSQSISLKKNTSSCLLPRLVLIHSFIHNQHVIEQQQHSALVDDHFLVFATLLFSFHCAQFTGTKHKLLDFNRVSQTANENEKIICADN